MGGKNRKQDVTLVIESGRIDHLPPGEYSVYIDATYIEKGSITLKARVIDSIEKKEVPHVL